MNVKIYEERTGQLIFPIVPGKEPEKDENVISFFNNHIDLYVEKKVKELRISCRVFIQQQGTKESRGYYIKSLSKYEDDSFTEFKKESNKALNTLGISRSPDDINNAIIDNIEKLDMDIYFHEDTDIIAHILGSGEYLEYQAGNIDEITILCKDILKRIATSKIAISFEACKLGDVNILRTQKREESLSANERSRAILEKHKKELIEQKRKEEESVAREKINNGTDLIKEGLTILRSSGHEPQDISDEIDKIYDEISASNKIRLKEKKPKEIVRGREAKKDSGRGASVVNKPKLSKRTIVIIAIIGALLLYSIIWGSPINGINKLIGRNAPEPEQGNTSPPANLPPIGSATSNNFGSTDNNKHYYETNNGINSGTNGDVNNVMDKNSMR